jgi:hypothetical protein
MDNARVSANQIAVRDVALIALRGAPRTELLAKYPELRDEDIDLATQIASAPLDSSLYEEVDEVRFRRHPDHTPRVQISEFDRWVSQHNIPETFEYGKGFDARRMADRCSGCSTRIETSERSAWMGSRRTSCSAPIAKTRRGSRACCATNGTSPRCFASWRTRCNSATEPAVDRATLIVCRALPPSA